MDEIRNNETPVTETAAEEKEKKAAPETMDDLKDELEASFRTINEGDVLTGTVIGISDTEILVDFDYYAPGVIPLENSSAGSVNEVYDLMMKHRFRIVRSIRLKVDHNLLVKPGTRKEDIREIYSHEQAISQCSEYLKQFPNAKIIPCENTAIAAKRVSESENANKAAIASSLCAKLYHLSMLSESIQNEGNNTTRFICISKQIEIYPGADRTSLMMVLPHEPGALYKVLSRFYALGINLIKLESRPIPERNFEFMFYFDLETSVYSPQFLQLMGELESLCERFSYLGSYGEVV